jgi:hypothetical protein
MGFLAIIDGMEMDARSDIQAPSLAELDLYCSRVAVAVGLLSVRIFGVETEAADRVAAELGGALQLTTILRDLDEDAERNRLYLPRELLGKHGLMAATPRSVLSHPALRLVLRGPGGRSRASLRRGPTCPRRLPAPQDAPRCIDAGNVSRASAFAPCARLEASEPAGQYSGLAKGRTPVALRSWGCSSRAETRMLSWWDTRVLQFPYSLF